jgi:hypothetical protein
MNECVPIRRCFAASKERQVLVGAYPPVVVFALLLVISEIARIRQHLQEAAIS